MAHTYHQLYYHFVWSTKERRSLILTNYESRIYSYLSGTFKSLKCYPIEIGGMPDHIHALVGVPPHIEVSEMIRNLKVSSSKWITSSFPLLRPFAWQEGFGAFSASYSNTEVVAEYIRNQKEHHSSGSFRDEFLALLRKHGVEFEEKYLWK